MAIRETAIATIGLGLLLLACTAAAQDSDSKERGVYEKVTLTDKDYHLIETSEEMHEQFQRRGLMYPDANLEAWLQRIGDSLAPEPTDFYIKYQFFLFHDPSPNAFALPNGQIYVHTGLISRLENESQLATLLAHEINHVAGHHGVLGFRSQKKKAGASIFFSIVGAAAGGWGDLAGALINVGLYNSMFGYSRDLEQEADIKGYDLMLDAGYDVREMHKLFEILGQDFEGLQPRMSGKWSTHPDLVLRGEYTTRLAADTPADKLENLRIGGDDFRSRVRPMALVTVRDYILDDYPKTALKLAQDLVAEDPDDAYSLVAMGHSYIALGARSEFDADVPMTDKEKKQQVKIRSKMTRDELQAEVAKSPEARTILERNLAEAEKAYTAALQLDENAFEAYLGFGEIHMRRQNYRESARALMTYLKLNPQASDKSIVMSDLRDIANHLKTEAGGDVDEN